MDSVGGNNINRIPFKNVKLAAWCYCLRKFCIRAFIRPRLFTRRFRWWLAAIVGIISLSVSLSISIPAISAAQRERSRLECKTIEGNRDMYGIGIRIAIYLQGVMTIFGEVYNSDPKYATALTSVNLWFVWALIIAAYFCKYRIQLHDVDMTKSLGDIIVNISLGSLLLPPRQLDIESVLTRVMRWVTFSVWHAMTPHVGINVADPNIRVKCTYEWFFLVYTRIGTENRPRQSFNRIFHYGVFTLVIPILTLMILIYVAKFPWRRIEAALNCCNDMVGTNKYSLAEVWVDILCIYPAGDVMGLSDAESLASYQAGWFDYVIERYALPPDAFEPVCTPLAPPAQSPIAQLLWTALRAPRRINTHIDRWQARVIWNTAILIFYIQTIEFTIMANDIQGVNDIQSMGQLLALVIGVGTLMAMCAEAITKNRSKLYGVPLRAREVSPHSSD